ncbi:hypothetical protein [Sporosarcina pasteurii]|uniref:Stage III sporulation protein AD n=1 Tax=Sporosarcina pasteurii TaxID=1474 RepID=A0A380BPE8_SPOPA|nr:hypothetical protein [Sporosarcina pasteurii]MDS9471098.1 hypothetical protein [Sporosarcina pasteurii]QBQ05259.1 hypothetical protein E2C16_06040 [Sporosarcina pasteurii]SUJ04744.1 Uncharacterised protein [Sporosarcina pasteurii]
MVTLFQVIVVFLLLLTISFVVPKLQPLLYTAVFFLVLTIILTTVVFPFGRTLLQQFEALPNPYVSLLVGSAILFYLSELISSHIADAGYASLAKISHFAVKITILLLWMNQAAEVIDILSALITK